MVKDDHLLNGINFFWQGVRLVLSPTFKRFIIVPIIVNIFLLIGLISLLFHFFSNSFSSWVTSFPHWLVVILGWLLWLIFWTTSLLICTLIFTVLTNIIASPFYGLLAEKAEKNLTAVELQLHEMSFGKTILHALYRELLKIIYFIPWLLLCLLLFVFPLSTFIAPLVWWLVLAWILSIQYIDYCADNQRIPFKKMVKSLKKAPYTVVGFGGIVTFFMVIPGANLIIPPAAVAGGTALWLWLNDSHSKNGLNLSL